jgi:hypothetical protein
VHYLRVVSAEDLDPAGCPAYQRRWLRVALALWIGFWVAHSVKTLHNPAKRTVYPIFSQAARNWFNDAELYQRVRDKDQYYYAPVCAALTVPLGLLPDGPGGVLWSGLSLAVLFLALRSWFRSVLAPRFAGLNEGQFLALCLGITIQGAWSGQSNALILACLLFASAAITQDRWWAAAFLLALPIQIKIWPLAAAGLLVLRWPRLIPRLIAASAALALLPLLMKSPDIVLAHYQDWFDTLLGRTFTEVRRPGYRDAWILWETLWPPVHSTIYGGLQAAGGLLLLGYLWFDGRKWADDRQYLLGALSLWSCWQLLLGPGSERLTYGIVAPFASWAVLRSFQTARGRTLALASWLFAGPLGTGEAERLLMRLSPAAPVLVPCSIILLASWFLLYELRQPRALVCEADDPPVMVRRAA